MKRKWIFAAIAVIVLGSMFFGRPFAEEIVVPPAVETVMSSDGMVPDAYAWHGDLEVKRNCLPSGNTQYKVIADSQWKPFNVEWEGDPPEGELPPGGSASGKAIFTWPDAPGEKDKKCWSVNAKECPIPTNTPIPPSPTPVSPTETPVPSPTPEPPTATPIPPSPTAEDTPVPTATDTPRPTPTDTLVPPSPTLTATETHTPITPTPTATATETATPTATAIPTATATTSPRETATATTEPHKWRWDSHFGCDFFKVSSLNDSDSPVKAEAWIWDGAGKELLYYWEIVQPADDAWFNAQKDTPLGYTGHVTARIVLSNPETGRKIAHKDFATEEPLNCESICINDGLNGFLNYTDNHLSGLPVTGEVWNPSGNACADTAYLYVFGSMHLEPEGPGWLESQEHVTSFVIDVPEGNDHVGIKKSFDRSEYCWYQVDLVPVAEVRIPPYYSGEDMIEYVFVKGTNPLCEPPPKKEVEVAEVAECPIEPVLREIWDLETRQWEIYWWEYDSENNSLRFNKNLTQEFDEYFRNPTVRRDNCAWAAEVWGPDGHHEIRVYDFGMNLISIIRDPEEEYGEPEFVLNSENNLVIVRESDHQLFIADYRAGKLTPLGVEGRYPHSIPGESFIVAYTSIRGKLAYVTSEGEVLPAPDVRCDRPEWKPDGSEVYCRVDFDLMVYSYPEGELREVYEGFFGVALDPDNSGRAVLSGPEMLFIEDINATTLSLEELNDMSGWGSDWGDQQITPDLSAFEATVEALRVEVDTGEEEEFAVEAKAFLPENGMGISFPKDPAEPTRILSNVNFFISIGWGENMRILDPEETEEGLFLLEFDDTSGGNFVLWDSMGFRFRSDGNEVLKFWGMPEALTP